jgi:hypothetical protein
MRPDYARAAYSYTNRAVLGFSMLFFQVWKIKIRAGFFPYQILNIPCYREKKKYRTLKLWIRDTSKILTLKILIRYTQKIFFCGFLAWSHDKHCQRLRLNAKERRQNLPFKILLFSGIFQRTVQPLSEALRFKKRRSGGQKKRWGVQVLFYLNG